MSVSFLFLFRPQRFCIWEVCDVILLVTQKSDSKYTHVRLNKNVCIVCLIVNVFVRLTTLAVTQITWRLVVG